MPFKFFDLLTLIDFLLMVMPILKSSEVSPVKVATKSGGLSLLERGSVPDPVSPGPNSSVKRRLCITPSGPVRCSSSMMHWTTLM